MTEIWKAEQKQFGYSWIVVSNDDLVCEVERGEQEEDRAHLIAAAPELYEALKDLLAVVLLQTENAPENMPFSYGQAQAALAKARGEAE
jgi:hypothetical protein